MSNKSNVSAKEGLCRTLLIPHRAEASLHVLYTPPQLSMSTLNSVVFRKYADASIGGKFLSLFPGLGYAAGYKILQRVYKCVDLSFLPLGV